MARTSRVRVRVESHRAVVVDAIRKAMRAKVYLMGKAVERQLKEHVLVGPRTGKWYRKPGTGQMYQASAPGEPPALRLGDLRRSYQVGKLEEEPGRVQVKVGSPLEHAPILQHKMNRPHLDTALDLARPEIEKILKGDWERDGK